MSRSTRGTEHLSKKAATLSQNLPVEIIFVLQRQGPASAAEIAAYLQVPAEKVRYHLRQLAEVEIIKAVEKKPRRGVVERFYVVEDRETMFEDDDLKDLPPAKRNRMLAKVLKLSLGGALNSLKAGLLTEREGSVLTYIPLSLDSQGWSALSEIHREAFERTMRVRSESLLRLRENGEEPISASSTILLAELPPFNDTPPDQ